MANKEIAVVGCTWKFPTGHSGTVTVISPASTKMTCSSLGVYKDNLSVSISAGTNGTVSNATGTGTINATATKTKCEGSFVLRKGDSNLIPIVMTGTITSPPYTGTYNETIEIDSAGQTKVKCE